MGFRNSISSPDLPGIHEKLSSATLAARVQSNWERGKFVLTDVTASPLMLMLCTGDKRGRQSLMAQVVFSFPAEILLIVIPRTLEVGLTIAYPFLVQEAITFLDSPSAPVSLGAFAFPWGLQ